AAVAAAAAAAATSAAAAVAGAGNPNGSGISSRLGGSGRQRFNSSRHRHLSRQRSLSLTESKHRQQQQASRRSPHVSGGSAGGGAASVTLSEEAVAGATSLTQPDTPDATMPDQTTPLLDTGYGISGGGGGGSSSQMLRLLSATNAPEEYTSICDGIEVPLPITEPPSPPSPASVGVQQPVDTANAGGSGGGAAGGAVEAMDIGDRSSLADVEPRGNGVGIAFSDVGAAGQTLEAMLRNAEEAERLAMGPALKRRLRQLSCTGAAESAPAPDVDDLSLAAATAPVGGLDSAGVTASESLINIVEEVMEHLTDVASGVGEDVEELEERHRVDDSEDADSSDGGPRYRIQAMSSPAADEAAKREATQPAAAAADTVGAAATPNGGNYKDSVNALRSTFLSGQTRPLSWRRKQLEALYALLTDQEDRIAEALWQDLRKCRQEAAAAELLILKADIAKLNRDLPQLTDIHKVKKTFISMMDNLGLQQQPYGVALIIGAWNYPFQLTLMPLAGAIAAGNCALVKPSEIASASAALLAELVPKYLDQSCIRVVCGGAKETQELLEQRFDYIFYTGSSRVGRLVMAAASKHLTPVTLELGGKSPVYVSEGVDLGQVSKRLVWGKFLNAGQTCIAPDYVMCPPELAQPLADAVAAQIAEFYGQDPKASPDYGRIVSDRMFDRIVGLMQASKADRATGGDTDRDARYIAPTVYTNVRADDALMREEIFGPLMPIMPVSGVEEAVYFINKCEKPLAIYVFTHDGSVKRRFEEQTSSGALVFNDVVIHAGMETLSFGGVGHSGMGKYHGRFTFDTFSHQRALLYKSSSATSEMVNNKFRYPPYNDSKLAWVNWALSSSVKKGSTCVLM
uniref:Aldedh domain-containing protein n=1 Tax=Macrostomum lignano TaxID=282301 RepID=A0A1I8GEQ0_9PLAT